MKRALLQSACAALCVFVASVSITGKLCGQASASGGVTGRVVDPSGATVAQAAVELVDEATSVKKSVSTNAEGYYTFPLLSPTTFFLVVTSLISALKAFDVVNIMTDGGPMNSSNVYVLYLYQNAFRWFKTGYASALAWVLFGLIMVVTVIQIVGSRRFVYYEGQK